MSISKDIEQFRMAERDAQDMVEQAQQEAHHIRLEAAARVEELNAEAENDLASVREKLQVEARREVEAMAGRSRERVAAARKEA